MAVLCRLGRSSSRAADPHPPSCPCSRLGLSFNILAGTTLLQTSGLLINPLHTWEGQRAVYLKDGAGQELLAGARAGCRLFRQGSGSAFLESPDPDQHFYKSPYLDPHQDSHSFSRPWIWIRFKWMQIRISSGYGPVPPTYLLDARRLFLARIMKVVFLCFCQ